MVFGCLHIGAGAGSQLCSGAIAAAFVEPAGFGGSVECFVFTGKAAYLFDLGVSWLSAGLELSSFHDIGSLIFKFINQIVSLGFWGFGVFRAHRAGA